MVGVGIQIALLGYAATSLWRAKTRAELAGWGFFTGVVAARLVDWTIAAMAG
jgi:hypothetical protein